MREHWEQVADEVDEVMLTIAARNAMTWQPWQHVDWLRVQADLLDRLGAACGGAGPVSGRAELLRDRAERMADHLNGVPSAADHPPPPPDLSRYLSRAGAPQRTLRPVPTPDPRRPPTPTPNPTTP
ncbi:hypothetical protein [Saccharothrix hoggarensis]|uniref:Uncharacterized protein n=1 Tax=Saccharothrix hoggarensis TaxID=913853 RepID=A0ABW3QGR3_9PSEU